MIFQINTGNGVVTTFFNNVGAVVTHYYTLYFLGL
jgi:hypothetical protein